jgi:hypothetical protein
MVLDVLTGMLARAGNPEILGAVDISRRRPQ